MNYKYNIAAVIACFVGSCFFSCEQEKNSQKKQASMSEDLSEEMQVSSSFLPVDDYMRWVENKDNGLQVEKKIGEVTFSALYKPYEYLAIMETGKENLTSAKLKERIHAYEGLQYFTFKIEANNTQKELLKTGIHSEQDYYSRLEYFSFEMQKDFKLIEGTDTLDCVLYHFERIYGLAPVATVVLGFPLTKGDLQESKINKTIGYTDRVFGAGNVYMTIRKENLDQIPQVKLN